MNHETATALDPQAKAVIDLIIKSGRPLYHQLSPKDARQLFRDTRPASTPPAPEIGAVKDLTADGPAGTIPARLYRPKGVPASTMLPALVFFHGGGWVIGDIETHDVLCRQLTAGAGISVVNIDYRLAPEHKFPAAVDAAWAATRSLARVAPALVVTAGFDPLRDEGDAYARKLHEAGVRVDTICYGGMIHGFVPMGRLIETGNRAVAHIAATLRQELQPPG